MERVVIVGAGLAGHRAAQALRRVGFGGDVTMVGDEIHRPYDRPPLSKQVLAGVMRPHECTYDCDGLGVTWMLGRSAVALDGERKLVVLDGNDSVPYDGLIIATGRGARGWPVPSPLEGLHTLRTLDDAQRLRRAVRPRTRAVIVGAGFIGCEVAATLRGLDADVTLVDVAPQPMAVLGPQVGERAVALHESHGVRLCLGTSVAAFEGDSHVEAVRLENGERLPADLVLLALGSAPSSAWLEGSGIELLQGSVVCDEYCFAVGRDDVVAAGDVAAYPYRGASRRLTVEHWATARDLGALAAANLLALPSERRPFVGVPSVWSDQYGVKIKTTGLLALADEFVILEEDPDRRALVVEARRDGALVGAIAFNRNRKILEYQRHLAGAGVSA